MQQNLNFKKFDTNKLLQTQMAENEETQNTCTRLILAQSIENGKPSRWFFLGIDIPKQIQ